MAKERSRTAKGKPHSRRRADHMVQLPGPGSGLCVFTGLPLALPELALGHGQERACSGRKHTDSEDLACLHSDIHSM